MRVERWLFLGALSLFVVSLLLPAVDGPGFPAQSGFDMLQQGAGAWRDGIVAWYANPALGLALLLGWFGRYRFALGIAVAGLLLALSSFTAATMAENAGRSIPVFQFAVGFYGWLTAMVLAASAAGYGIYKASRAQAT